LKVYDETIGVLKSAISKAKLGCEEELAAIRRLDDQARQMEATVSGPPLETIVANEFDRSNAFGGRSAFGWEQSPERSGATKR
jgi:uncharacterized protein